MFGKLLERKSTIKVLAPLSGNVIPITQVSDPTFSGEMLGKGIAIIPDGGHVVSPISGTVTQMFDTGHAVSLTSDDGVEVLIHVGLDTVKLNGRHFTIHTKTGSTVRVGDLLIEFDAKAIASDGYETLTPIVICNSDDFKAVHIATKKTVSALDELVVIKS